MIRTSISTLQDKLPIDRSFFKDIVQAVLLGEGLKNADISLAFVDNATIHDLNRRFLQHDEPTDVITFPLSGKGAKKLEAEIVLGVEVALERAAEAGHSPTEELALYVIHGLLHLCGYDDHAAEDIERMREAERYYLDELGLPDIAEK